MALDLDALAKQLEDLFAGKPSFPSDASDAGKKWAGIYRAYAKAALAGTTLPVTAALDTAESALASALGAAFSAAKAAGPTGAAALLPLLDAAFLKFWSTPIPFAVPLPPAPPTMAGVVTPPASGGLATLMGAAFPLGLLPVASTHSQAKAIATAFDTWTKTVKVVNTPVPSGPASNPIPLA